MPCANAADVSVWSGDSRSAARLIAGAPRNRDGITIDRAGVEIRLAEGWKTYWRYPGDSGVPPQFDFSASDNIRAVSVQWPAPQRFTDAEGSTIGYKTNVVFPLQIERQDNGRPVTLRMKLDYAICEKLCVPVQASAELTLADSSGEHEQSVRVAEALVPRPQTQHAHAPLSIGEVIADKGSSPQRLTIEVAAPQGQPPVLFAEGPSSAWALPLPELKGQNAKGNWQYALVLEGLPPGISASGATIRLTAVVGGQAVETPVRLD